MLLVPRPPEFASASASAEESTGIKDEPDTEKVEAAEPKTLDPGADAVPASVKPSNLKHKYRLITIGKKHLPDPEKLAGRSARKEIFWATVTAVGDNLEELHSGLEPKTYETKTRGGASRRICIAVYYTQLFLGTRHESSCRLVGRGVYAIANIEARTPSKRENHIRLRPKWVMSRKSWVSQQHRLS